MDPDKFSTGSIVGLLYLIVVGSLLAFSAYTWLLRNVPISKVSTYAYVNPVIAVALGGAGALRGGDRGGGGWAAAIVLSVATVVRREAPATDAT